MQSSSRLSTDSGRPSSTSSAANEVVQPSSLPRSDSNVMSLVYPDGRVMTIQLREQLS